MPTLWCCKAATENRDQGARIGDRGKGRRGGMVITAAMLAISGQQGRAAGPDQSAPSPKLVRAAHEFEGQLMKELLRPMTDGDGLGDDNGDNGDAGSGGALGEFATEAMGQALSERGGFGIADRIVRELGLESNRVRNGK
jgi:Rod binding domain-containing protein